MPSTNPTDNTLYVVIGCDCDPDRPQYGGVRYDTRAPLKWRGVREGIPQAREIADDLHDDFGNPVRITWCVRSDLQMQEIYGDCAWPYAEFADLWESLAERGDEIAWHPHLWRWSDEHGCWYQEIEDEGWMRDCLYQGYTTLTAHMGCAPTTSRMGWEFHNNITMRQINDLGIKVDFSAVPGRLIPGRRDKWGSVFSCEVDWRNTPEQPYVPSAADCRTEANAEGTAMELVELPMSTFRSRLLGMGAHLRRAAKAKGGDRLKQLFTMSNPGTASLKAYITIHPYIFSRLAATQLNKVKENGCSFLVTAFHADELLKDSRVLARLHGAEHLQKNLERLRRACTEWGVHLRFVTARELSAVIEEHANASVTTPRPHRERLV